MKTVAMQVGELLIDPGSSWQLLPAPPWLGPGLPTPVELSIPDFPGLIGLKVYGQGLFVDTSDACGTQYGLTDAVELILGR